MHAGMPDRGDAAALPLPQNKQTPSSTTSADALCGLRAVQFYDVARKEIAALILSDDHPNVLRCFAMEEDEAFVYLALERCSMSLSDLMQSDRARLMDSADNPTEFACEVSRVHAMPALCLTKAHPAPLCDLLCKGTMQLWSPCYMWVCRCGSMGPLALV